MILEASARSLTCDGFLQPTMGTTPLVAQKAIAICGTLSVSMLVSSRKTGADNQPAPVRRVCGEYNRRSALLGTLVGDCFHLCFDGSLVAEVPVRYRLEVITQFVYEGGTCWYIESENVFIGDIIKIFNESS